MKGLNKLAVPEQRRWSVYLNLIDGLYFLKCCEKNKIGARLIQASYWRRVFPIKTRIGLIHVGFDYLELIRTAIFFLQTDLASCLLFFLTAGRELLVRRLALVVYLQHHRRKRTVHVTKMFVNGDANLECKLGEDQ